MYHQRQKLISGGMITKLMVSTWIEMNWKTQHKEFSSKYYIGFAKARKVLRARCYDDVC